MRLVLISFVFLFWVFYELSGGADFEPRGTRPAGPERTPAQMPDDGTVATDGTTADPPAATAPAPAGAEAVARAAAGSAAGNVAGNASESPPETAPQTAADTGADTAAITGTDTGTNTGTNTGAAPAGGLRLFPVTVTAAALPPALSEGLEAAAGASAAAPQPPGTTPAPGPGAASPAPQPAAAEPPPDLREIAGTRVNMRDGPGTIYPVIARLRLGQKVEILGESGTGWLRLRPAGSRLTGWVAASLVGRPRR